MDSPESKIYHRSEDFLGVRDELRKDGRTIVFTNGCFDIIHRGHCEYLFEAQQLGDFLVVGLNSDDSVRRLKGQRRPINSFDDRAYILSSFYFVDAVVLFDEDTPLKLIEKIRPDILVKGEDYEISEIVGAEQVEQWGGKVVRIPIVDGYSTSGIIEKIIEINERN